MNDGNANERFPHSNRRIQFHHSNGKDYDKFQQPFPFHKSSAGHNRNIPIDLLTKSEVMMKQLNDFHEYRQIADGESIKRQDKEGDRKENGK